MRLKWRRTIEIIAAAQRWVGFGLFLANLGNSEQQTGEKEGKTIDNNVNFGTHNFSDQRLLSITLS